MPAKPTHPQVEMFNWFRRSSKSAPDTQVQAPSVHPPQQPPSERPPLPAGAEKLSLGAQQIIATLPPSVMPQRVCERHPHVLEQLLVHWRSPARFRQALDRMLIDDRGSRQGFSFEVVSELGALREHYDLYVNPVKTTAWNSTTAR